jgi:hypothetical protein
MPDAIAAYLVAPERRFVEENALHLQVEDWRRRADRRSAQARDDRAGECLANETCISSVLGEAIRLPKRAPHSLTFRKTP